MINVKDLAKFLKNEVNFLAKNEEYAGAYYKLDGVYSAVVAWQPGFGDEERDGVIQERDDVIQSKENLDYALIAAIKITNPSDTPDAWNIPYDEKTGELYVEDYSITPNEDYEGLAQTLINDYEFILSKDEEAEDEEEVKVEVEEACDSQLKEATGNFRVQKGLPILAFDVEDYSDEKEASEDIRILSEDEYRDLEDELEVANEKFWAKYHEIMDDDNDERYEYLEPGEVEFRIEAGYYDYAQVIVKGYEDIQTEELKELAKKLYLEIGKKFNLTKLERDYVFSSGETGYKKVEKVEKSKKSSKKELTEDLIHQNFNDTFDDLADRALTFYREGHDIEESIRLAIDEELVWNDDIALFAGYYVDASELLELYYEELSDDLYNEVKDLVKDEDEDEKTVADESLEAEAFYKKEVVLDDETKDEDEEVEVDEDDWDNIKPLDITDADLEIE